MHAHMGLCVSFLPLLVGNQSKQDAMNTIIKIGKMCKNPCVNTEDGPLYCAINIFSLAQMSWTRQTVTPKCVATTLNKSFVCTV